MNFQKKVPVQRVYLQTDWNAIVLLCTALSCGAGGDCYVRSEEFNAMPLKPGVHTNDLARFTVGAPVFTQRPRKTIRRINSRLRRCCVNTGAATVNRGEIVSMYAGLNRTQL